MRQELSCKQRLAPQAHVFGSRVHPTAAAWVHPGGVFQWTYPIGISRREVLHNHVANVRLFKKSCVSHLKWVQYSCLKKVFVPHAGDFLHNVMQQPVSSIGVCETVSRRE